MRRRLAPLSLVAGAALVLGVVVAGVGQDRGRDVRRPPDRSEREPRRDLRRQVGQLLVSSFDGTEVPAYLRRQLAVGEIAGVVLFGRNATSAAGLRRVTAAIQRAARGAALVAADQEGGAVRSLPFAPPEAGQPVQRDPTEAAALARRSTHALRGMGVNVNLAPVADLPEGPVAAGRAFPGGPRQVAALTAAAVRGARQGGAAPTVKHFPGFGSALRNTDDGPVTIDRDRAALEDRDLAPFRAAVRAGVPLAMASHALYPALDRRRIASQSPAILRTLLRRRLRFRGAVVTDSIEADAVLRRSSVGLAAVRSVAAGADLVLMTGSGSWRLIFPRLLREARRSAAFRARVMEAAARVRRLKRIPGLRSPG